MLIFCSQANPFDVIKYDAIKDADTKLETRTIGLHFLLPPLFWVKGKLMVSSFFGYIPVTSIVLFTYLIKFIMVVILFITSSHLTLFTKSFSFHHKKKIERKYISFCSLEFDKNKVNWNFVPAKMDNNDEKYF